MSSINNLLNFSKTDAKQITLENIPFNPTESMQNHASEQTLPSFIKANKIDSLVNGLPSRHDRISREIIVGVTHCDANHNDLFVGNTRVLSHHRRLHDALTIDHTAEATRPGGIH